MKYIKIMKDGSVVGDVSTIIAYENEQYSEPIRFSYPALGAEYIKYVVYTWGVTKFENSVDANDIVKLMIQGPGVITAQFYAKNPVTGEIGLQSKPFQLVVHKSIVGHPDYFSNAPQSTCIPHCPPRPSMPIGDNMVETVINLSIELHDEQKVRATQDSNLWEELYALKDALVAAGINTYEPVATIEDCNKLLAAGKYYLKEGSTNTPDGEGESNCPYVLHVDKFNYQILQTAYASNDGDNRVYYRTGTLLSGAQVEWQMWIPMIHETKVEEI